MTLELIPQIEQALHTQTIRETTQQDFDKFSKLDELITGTRNILHLRYSWDTIQEDRVKRKENFDQLSEKDQQVTQEALIASLESNNSHLIPALFFIGRETDLGIIDEVPEDQRTNMEIAVRFCRANEFKNQAGSIVSKGKEQEISQNDYNRLLSVCSELIEELHELQKFTIIATHSTDAKARTQIEEEGKMVSLYKKDHYLGEGIYAGVFGGFLDWNGVDESGKMRNTEKNTYRFAVPLSECNLLINNPLAPRAMINIQHGSIDLNSISTLSEQKLSDTIPQAQIEGNPSYERDIGKQLNPQGVYLFRRLVKDLNLDFGFIGDAKSKSLIRQRRDETVENQKHLLIDTEEPPLIWASLSDICGLERITVVEDFDEKFEEVA